MGLGRSAGTALFAFSTLLLFLSARELFSPRAEVFRESFELAPLSYRSISIPNIWGGSYKLRVRSTGGADLWKRDYCRRIEGLAASRITYHEYPPGSSYEAIPKERNSAPAQAQLAERLELGYVIGHETGKQTKDKVMIR